MIVPKCSESKLRLLLKSEAGTTAMMMGLMLLSIMTVVGFAVDYHQASNRRSTLQHALDNAVLAAAVQSGDNGVKLKAGLENYDSNGFDFCSTKPTLNFEDDVIRGSIECRTKTNILGIIGIDSVDVGVKSAAKIGGTSFHCVHALSASKSKALIYNNKRGPLKFVGDSIIAPECSVMVNSMASSALFIKEDEGYTFSQHCIVGGVSGDVTQITPQPDPACTKAAPDPLASRTFASAGACNSGSFSTIGGAVTLAPGTYCSGININSDDIKLEAGTYHLTGGDFILEGANSIKGEGIKIIMHPGSGEINFETEGELTLKSTDSAGKPDFLIIDKNGSAGEHVLKTSKNDTSSMTLDGVIYTPQDHFEFFWKRAGVAANEKPLYFTNFGVIADTIDLHGYNQLYISVPEDRDVFPELYSSKSAEARLTN
jgi:hypothetical protein